MKRRSFLQSGSALGIGLCFPIVGCHDWKENPNNNSTEFQTLAEDLLQDWCNGMLQVQIHQPEDATLHVALDCPACNKIHGRCMDAVYPMLYRYSRSKIMERHDCFWCHCFSRGSAPPRPYTAKGHLSKMEDSPCQSW